ncbi:MAG: alpha/beta fold hydrolase [Candidatus Limnocylindria bacterium]
MDELAADPPGPAAGSAAAIVVAIAAALTELAARRSGEDALASRAASARTAAVPLAETDARAYAAVLRARGHERRAALGRASDVLRQIGDAAGVVEELAAPLVERARPALRGEAAAAVELARAARRVSERLIMFNRDGQGQREIPARGWALGRRAQLSRGVVAWDVFGAGPPVVLVHGTPSSSYLWRNVVPGLAREFSVYLLDLPGYGDSPEPAADEASIATHATMLLELLEHWGVEEPAVAGHDIGGAVTLRAHLLGGRRLRRLALVDAVVLTPWITPTTRHIQAHLDVYRTMPNQIFEQITSAHLRTAVATDVDERAFAAYQERWRGEAGQAAYLQRVAHFDEQHTREFEPLLSGIRVPVLILWGTDDAWLDPALAGRLGDLIPRAVVGMVPRAGHFVMEDAPAEVTRSLLDFFRG